MGNGGSEGVVSRRQPNRNLGHLARHSNARWLALWWHALLTLLPLVAGERAQGTQGGVQEAAARDAQARG